MFAEKLANFDNVLIERPAAYVCVHSPDGVDEGMTADNDPRVGVEMEEDAQFFTANFTTPTVFEF